MTKQPAPRYNQRSVSGGFLVPFAVQKRVLILHYDRTRRLCGRGGYLKPARLPIFLGVLLALLRLMGYRFKTVSDAMAASYGKYACITFDGCYTDVARKTFPFLLKRRIPATLTIATSHVGRRSVVPQGLQTRRRTSGLGWGEIRELVQHGWEVGTTGHHFVNLTERSQRDQEQNIERARQLIEQNLGSTPRVFAYPFGAFDTSTLKFLKEHGFFFALTHRSGAVEGPVTALQLPRIALSAGGILPFVKLLWMAIRPLTNPNAQNNGTTIDTTLADRGKMRSSSVNR